MDVMQSEISKLADILRAHAPWLSEDDAREIVLEMVNRKLTRVAGKSAETTARDNQPEKR